MTTTFKIDNGFKHMASTMEGIGANMTKAMQNAVEAAATEMHGTMVKSIQKPSPSAGPVKRYTPSKKKGGTARIVTPAKKGYAPNRDSGNLGSSIKWDHGELWAAAGTTGVIRDGYDYAEGLEKTHPYIKPAFEKAEARYEKRINRAIQRHIKGN